MEVIKDYDVHISSKRHVTLRGAKYQYYNVREYENGCIMLEPRELVTSGATSEGTLEDMDQTVRDSKMGKVSAPIE